MKAAQILDGKSPIRKCPQMPSSGLFHELNTIRAIMVRHKFIFYNIVWAQLNDLRYREIKKTTEVHQLIANNILRFNTMC